MTDKLGVEWRLREVMTKPYACNARLAPQIEALAEVMQSHGIKAKDVRAIRVGVDSAAISHGLADHSLPTTSSEIQMSTPIAMALRLVSGANDFAAYADIALDDGPIPEPIADLARRVETYADAECTEMRSRGRMAKVSVETIDGRTVSALASAPRPADLREGDVLTKFRSLAARRVDDDTVEQIAEAVLHLETLKDVRTLTALLRPV